MSISPPPFSPPRSGLNEDENNDIDDDDGNVGVELFFGFVFWKLSLTDLHVKPLVSELPSCSALARTQDP
jgi:hypothetical protein